MSEHNMPSIEGKSNVLTVVVVEGDPRIRDLDLGKRLGFANPIDIRKLIRRHEDALARMGVLATAAKTSDIGGRPATEYYLNRKQAIFITAKSDTPDATDITIEVIQKFDAYESGLIKQPRDPMEVLNDPAAMRGILLTYTEKVLVLEDKVNALMPKADGFDRIANADGSMCITDAAKALQMRPKDLFDWMRRHSWIYTRQGKAGYLAYQDKMQTGYLEHKVTTVCRPDGSEKVTEAVRVTPKGLSKLALLLNGSALQAAE